MGVVVRTYIDFLILSIPTPLVSVPFCSSIPTFCAFKKMFFVLYNYAFIIYCNARKKCENNIVRFEQNCSFAYRV